MSVPALMLGLLADMFYAFVSAPCQYDASQVQLQDCFINPLVQIINMEDSGTSRENLTWIEAQMDYLVQLLLEQSRIPGMKLGGGLKAKAYTAIERSMIDRFGRDFTKDKIKNKLKYAKPNLSVMKEIMNTSGFGYDPTNKCIQVDPPVWSEYIEDNEDEA
ncbi:hypothetical protein EJ110_NYTH22436 [Nymphaea thermarum]|nr:hypothetical protein EJ110_NYTH22436 [Nymphaea thermarum]